MLPYVKQRYPNALGFNANAQVSCLILNRGVKISTATGRLARSQGHFSEVSISDICLFSSIPSSGIILQPWV